MAVSDGSNEYYVLAVQMMYSGKNKGSLATAADTPKNSPPLLTPETTVGTAPKNTVAQTEHAVNPGGRGSRRTAKQN